MPAEPPTGEATAMKTAVIGAGPGCRAVLELFEQGKLRFLDLEILAVVDINPDAPGIRFARRHGWTVMGSVEQTLALPGLELVIELTGLDEVLDRIHRHVPPGVRVMDHVMARVFWDLGDVAENLLRELQEKTELQAKIDRDRRQLQVILDAIPDVVVVLDQEMRIVRVNEGFERLTGKLRDKVRGQPIREVFTRADGEDWSEEFAQPFDEVTTFGRPVTLIHSKYARSGREVHFQITANPLFDKDLKTVSVVETAREITERVTLKRETEESALRFQQITDAVHGIITIKDLEGRYQVVNPWTEQVVGISPQEMIGKTAADLFSKETADQIYKLDQETVAKGSRHVSEEVLHVGRKERILVSERLPLTDYKGDIVAICCVSQDQTRRRQLQRELVRTEQLAAVGRLAAGVAHELNNPLSGILSFAEDLLLQADDNDPAREDYDVIVNETLRCRRIVRDLLEFSRQKAPDRQWIQVNDIVSRVLMMVERQAAFQNIEFNVDLQESLPEVHADPHKIQQALLNLVINARDSMKAHGEIAIRSEVADEQAVHISVADTGCGIPEDELGEIFEPFFSRKGEEGHGLGLAAVRTIVEQHEGRVEVESRVGAGSTFRIVLPVSTE
jgi:PAS domain S-box-containing protein